MKFINKDGNPVNDGACVRSDHYIQTFTVVLKTMTPIVPGRLMNLIQEKFEVVDINQVDATCVVR